jgi:hypothetical protein
LTCPICQKRKAKRFCPAKAASICSVCCGTEREVTLDCPSECPYLIESRRHDFERREFDWSKLPFPDVKVDRAIARDQGPLLSVLPLSISEFARANPSLVDTDVVAALQALAETYRTLTSGIYYEKPPDFGLQRQLYMVLENSIQKFKKDLAGGLGAPGVTDSGVRDTLIFFTQLGARHLNGRPKGRAYLDLLRSESKITPSGAQGSDIIVRP